MHKSALLLASMLVACTELPAESELTSAIVTSNALTINGLSQNSVALNALSENGLSENRIALNDLVLDAPGREVARYLVSCALRADQELTVTVEGTDYTFPGQLGLAPRWIDRPLRETEKSWVSACMLARVNAYDISVLVSLRGKHDALALTREELADYPVQEAAFYGNIFTDGAPIEAYACQGTDQAAGETGTLEDRDCSEPDPANPGKTVCGFTYTGVCEDVCKRYDAPRLARGERDHRTGDDDSDRKHHEDAEGGYYSKCTGGGERHRQVVTVYLQP